MKNATKLFATAAALLAAGVSQVTAQSSANDALLEAAKSGTVEDVLAAIKAGADVNAGKIKIVGLMLLWYGNLLANARLAVLKTDLVVQKHYEKGFVLYN